MDDFLTQIYDEEMEKQAGSEMEDFMRTLPLEELEGFLKEAVAGPAEPPMPAAAQGKELDAKGKTVETQVAAEHDGKPRERHEETGKGQEKKAGVEIADVVGRLMAKQAASCKQTAFTTPEAKGKAALNIAKMKAGKIKQSEGDDEGMETTASYKAEVAARALNVSRNAPGHIKQAAVLLAGREIAKVAAKGKEVQHTYKSGFTPLSPGLGAVKGGTIGGALGGLGLGTVAGAAGGGKAALLGGLIGALGGGGIGAGAGATLSALKRKQLKSDRSQIAQINKKAGVPFPFVGSLQKEAFGVIVPVPSAPLNPERGSKGGGTVGGAVGGATGAAVGGALGAAHGSKKVLEKGWNPHKWTKLVPSKRAKLKGALGAALGLGAGALGGYYGGKALGRKSSESRRERVISDAKERMKMLKELREQ